MRDTNNSYGTAYRNIRGTHILHNAYTLCSLPSKANTRARATKNGVTISQAQIRGYLDLGGSWGNKITKYKAATSTRNQLHTIGQAFMNQIQARRLLVLDALLGDKFLTFPLEAGAKETAATMTSAEMDRILKDSQNNGDQLTLPP